MLVRCCCKASAPLFAIQTLAKLRGIGITNQITAQADGAPEQIVVSRRRLIHVAGAAGLVASFTPPMIRPARAAKKLLKIMQWNHFVPAFDEWFNKTYIKAWGERNDTEVIVTNVGMTSIESRAAAEISKKQGHDLCMFLSPPASYEDHVIDHRDIYAECERKYGKPLEIATKSTYNPITKKYFGFSDSYVPDPVNYRKDVSATSFL